MISFLAAVIILRITVDEENELRTATARCAVPSWNFIIDAVAPSIARFEHSASSMPIDYSIWFWLYLVPLIPSILCSIFVLYHLLAQRALRNAINNHVVILMLSFGLFLEVTDIVWFIHYYRTGTALSSTPAFCLCWSFVDAAGYVTVTMLMAWASIERHILIFHQNWIVTNLQRWLLHYLPLIILSVYPGVFYAVIFFIVPCDVPFDYTLTGCGVYSCIYNNLAISLWDNIAHYLLPIFLIVVFSVALLVRVLYHRCRVHGRIEWRNYSKMAVQLLSISAIYFVFLLPTMVFNSAYTFGLSRDVAADVFYTTILFNYYTILLAPFVCVVSLPELRSKLRQIMFCRGRQAVAPVSTTMARTKAPRTFGTAMVVK